MTLRSSSCLHAYQTRAIEHVVTHPQSMLWLDMGLGKTVITLSGIAEQLDRARVYGALVMAPLRVIQSVWRQEALKWAHTRHLRFSLLHGARDHRTRAALTPADVYLCNYENARWLADCWTQHYLTKGRYPPANMVVYDEVSRMKNATSQRHAAMQRLAPFMPYRIGLTGTPASNGYQDLFGQYLAVDGGARLGDSITAYKSRFFQYDNPHSRFPKEVPAPGTPEAIQTLVGDITLQMSNEDYLELPSVVENIIPLELPPSKRAQYEKLEEEMFIELDSGHEVASFNAAALTNRCLQFAQGAMYRNPGEPVWEPIHDVKLDALDEVVTEAAGKPVLVAVEFRHDAERILKRYPDWRWVDSRMSGTKFNETLALWVQGRLPGIIANPKSLGHGIDDLKDGPVDDLVWFGHTWSLDEYEQFPARLRRQGRTRPIRMHRFIMQNTTEVAQCNALASKATTQTDLKAALNEYRRHKHARGPITLNAIGA